MTDPVIPPAPAPRVPVPHARAAPADTAREFEAVFLGQMTQLMLQSVETGEEFSGGHAETMFRGVLAEKLGQVIAQRGGVGLAPAVVDQILKLQQGQP